MNYRTWLWRLRRLLSASWGTRKARGVIQSKSEGPGIGGLQAGG